MALDIVLSLRVMMFAYTHKERRDGHEQIERFLAQTGRRDCEKDRPHPRPGQSEPVFHSEPTAVLIATRGEPTETVG